jgi:serine phosphatase RsbU (regulator of sigma subunit)
MCVRGVADQVEAVVLSKPITTLGRLESSDVVVRSEWVSRRHALIERDGNRYVLRDCGARCGTFVNGRRTMEHVLAAGDCIGLGSAGTVDLTFEEASPARRPATGPSDAIDLTQVVAVLNILQAIGSGRVLDEVLALVIDAALATSGAERGCILLSEPAGELSVRLARARDGADLTGASLTTSQKIPREACRTARTIVVPDLCGADLADRHEESVGAGIRQVVCVPLRVVPPDGGASRSRITGVLYLDGRESGGMISRAAIVGLETLATEAALAIESARLYDEAAEKALIDHDLRLAADIQRALLPAPSCHGSFFDIAAAAAPCRTVGGDFFDYLRLDDGGVGFTLGDVAGKGPSAALLAVAVLNNFAALAPVSCDPAKLMSRVNSALLRRAVAARFATMFYGMIRPDGMLFYCNAGQEPPIVVRGDRLEWLETGGAVLGLLPDLVYDSGALALQSGDLVVLYSDGITEARNHAGEEFGRDRLAAVAEECRGASAQFTLDRLLSRVRSFSAFAAQHDDMTVLVMRYGPTASES